MSFVESIEEHASSIEPDAQLVGTLLEHRPDEDQSRPDYFYLTDLVNPQQAYWDHVGESPEPPEELLERFAHGNEMGRLARRALADVDGFTDPEALLDGAENGIPGVRGRIDFRYGNSLVEFKTTRHQIASSGDIWSHTPQYIEQLLFYSVLWTHDEPTHYLIYHLGDGPSSIRVFRVEVNDSETIREVLEARKSNLETALEDGDPSVIGRCRYHGDQCHVESAGLCDCDQLHELELSSLRHTSLIDRDDDLEEILHEAFQRVEDQPEVVSSWDLETPRQWYGRQIGVRERDPWIPDDQWVPGALASAGLLPGPIESPPSQNLEEALPFSGPGMMVRRTETTTDGIEQQWVPTLIRVRDYQTTPEPIRLRNQVMQIGCACATAGVDTGYIIVELPNADEDIVVYAVTFEDLDGIEEKIRDRLNLMNTALERHDVDQIPECPDWLQGSQCSDCLCEW